ncbi:MAG: hypothetical protein QXQ41_05885 [Candidatus Bathyarchaeia archaeon]
MAMGDFVIFALLAIFGELFVYKFISSYGTFKVSKASKLSIEQSVQRISKLRRGSVIEIIRTVKDDLASKCEYLPLKQMLQYVWSLSEEMTDQIADQYGVHFSDESKSRIDNELAVFADSYSKGLKLETYDSIARLLYYLLSKKEKNIEEIDRDALAKELKASSKSLAKGNPSYFLDVLSRYVQRPFKYIDVLLFINAVNDIVYRLKAKLYQGPTYYDFLRSIAKEIEVASKAISREDSLLLYETYERIFNKAWERVKKVDRFKASN